MICVDDTGITKLAISELQKLSNLKGVKLFDKYAVFCEARYCKLNDGLAQYIWDSGHLSVLGIERLSKSIREADLLNQL